MKVVIVGCGRVGAGVAEQLAGEGCDVTCVDEDEGALARLGEWRGGFVVGHGMDVDVLERAGVPTADAVVVATNGDNTNVVVGQVVQRRYAPGCVVVRVLDPRRAAFYAERGLRTVCPTQTAIATLTDVVRSSDASPVVTGSGTA
jgi:trk system potassium uptake protein TrkA